MGAADNKATVADAYEAFGKGDLAPIMAAVADDVVWVNHNSTASPMAGRYEGKDGVGRLALPRQRPQGRSTATVRSKLTE